MLSEIWEQIPWKFRILWLAGLTAQGALVAFLIWVIYRFTMRYT